MTDINTWFTTNYLKDNWKEIEEIHIAEKNLEGELTLKYEDFPKLERIFYTDDVKIINPFEIYLSNIRDKDKNAVFSEPKGVKINHYHSVALIKYTSLEERLEKSYPQTGRATITELNLKNEGLRGKLDLSDFTNLEELEIELSCPWHLKGYNSNYITDLDLSANTKLRKITLTHNPVNMDLKIFEGLNALEELNIAQNYDNADKWVGSINSLSKLPLKKLDISYNSKITDYYKLPLTITNLECKGLPFYEQIKPFAFDVKAWKMVHLSNLVKKDKAELAKEVNDKLIISNQTIKELNKKQLTDDDLLSQITLLEAKNRELV